MCVCVTARRCQTSRNIARLRRELRQIVPRRIHFTASPPRRWWRLLLGHRLRRSCGQTCLSVALAVHCQTRPALRSCGNKGKRRALNVMAGVMCPPARAADAAAQCAALSLLRWFSHRRRFAIWRLFLADGRDSASRRRHRVSVPCWSVTGERRSGLGQRHGEKTGRAGGYMRRPASFAGGAGSSWEAGSRRRTSA